MIIIFLQTQELFDINTLVSLGGASTATLMITNSLKYVFKLDQKWIPLVIAIAITLTSALITQTDSSIPEKLFLGITNGFVVFTSALGINIVAAPQERGIDNEKRKFNERWY